MPRLARASVRKREARSVRKIAIVNTCVQSCDNGNHVYINDIFLTSLKPLLTSFLDMALNPEPSGDRFGAFVLVAVGCLISFFVYVSHGLKNG